MLNWIERPLAIAIHERQLAEHGGNIGVRDDNLLDCALARPHQLHAHDDPPPDLAKLAASLAFGLATNHPFIDGNKRTAAVACETFIVLNNGTLAAADLELYRQYLALAEGSLAEAEFAAWLRQHIRSDAASRVDKPHVRSKR